MSTGLYELVRSVHVCVTGNVMVGEEGGKALGGSDRDQHAGGFLSEELVFTACT